MENDGAACEVCRSVSELGMIPNLDRIVCVTCASDAQNELIVRGRNKVGTEDWHGPKVELAAIVADMMERAA